MWGRRLRRQPNIKPALGVCGDERVGLLKVAYTTFQFLGENILSMKFIFLFNIA